MTIKEQAAYLKGMISGLELEENRKETKLFKEITDLLYNMSLSIDGLENDVDEVCEQLEIMDEDLEAVENSICRDQKCDCGCDEDDCECDDFYEVTCPKCGKKICLDEDTLSEEEMNCPNCGEFLEFDLDDIENGCSCGCDCDNDCDCEEDNCDCGCNHKEDK